MSVLFSSDRLFHLELYNRMWKKMFYETDRAESDQVLSLVFWGIRYSGTPIGDLVSPKVVEATEEEKNLLGAVCDMNGLTLLFIEANGRRYPVLCEGWLVHTFNLNSEDL